MPGIKRRSMKAWHYSRVFSLYHIKKILRRQYIEIHRSFFKNRLKKHNKCFTTPVLLIILEAIISINPINFTRICIKHFMKGILFIWLFVMCSIHLFAQKNKNRIEASVVGFFNGLSLVNADTLKFYVTPDFHLWKMGRYGTRIR
jgi:hypothetical protein